MSLHVISASLILNFFGRISPTSANNVCKARPKTRTTLLTTTDTTLRMVLDKHAPSKDIVRRGTRPYPWYNGNVEETRATRRQCGHCWRKAKLEVNRQLYVEARNSSTVCIAKAKSEYYQDTLQSEYYLDFRDAPSSGWSHICESANNVV